MQCYLFESLNFFGIKLISQFGLCPILSPEAHLLLAASGGQPLLLSKRAQKTVHVTAKFPKGVKNCNIIQSISIYCSAQWKQDWSKLIHPSFSNVRNCRPLELDSLQVHVCFSRVYLAQIRLHRGWMRLEGHVPNYWWVSSSCVQNERTMNVNCKQAVSTIVTAATRKRPTAAVQAPQSRRGNLYISPTVSNCLHW